MLDNSKFDTNYIRFMPLVIFVMCGFTFLLPGSIGFYLILRRNELYHPTVMSRIGWLYERMNRGSEAWEVIELSRKLILTSIIVFFPRDPTIRCCIALLVCIGAQVMLSLFRPHRSRLVFTTAQFGYGMALVNYLSASMLQSATLAEDSRALIGIIFVILQVSFLVFGLMGILASLYLIRKRFKTEGIYAETAEQEVLRDQQRRRSSSERDIIGNGTNERRIRGTLKSKETEKRESMTKLLNQVKSRDSRTDVVQKVATIMKRHSDAVRRVTKAITLRHKKSKDRLAKRRMSRVRPRVNGDSPGVQSNNGNTVDEVDAQIPGVYFSRVGSFGLPPELKDKALQNSMRQKMTRTLSGASEKAVPTAKAATVPG